MEHRTPPKPASRLAATPVVARWALLFAVSALFAGALEAIHIPAALMLGPMIAAIIGGTNGLGLRVAKPLFIGAQAIIGCLIARSVNPSLIGTMYSHIFLFIGSVFAVIVASSLLGWLMAHWRVLPGTTAVWGSAPGAATAMSIVAGAYGADMRLVAFMQYLRVVLVVATASLVAAIWNSVTGHVQPVDWFAMPAWPAFFETLAVAFGGAFLGVVLRIPAGALLVPLILGVILHGSGLMQLALPPWMLAASYALVGWNIGLGFTPEVLASGMRALPQQVGAILAQILLCAGLAWLLVRFAGIEPLTAYLATSPGGADSVAIIAASSKVDMSFVMALQTMRFLIVLFTGPSVARFIARHTGVKDAPITAR